MKQQDLWLLQPLMGAWPQWATPPQSWPLFRSGRSRAQAGLRATPFRPSAGWTATFSSRSYGREAIWWLRPRAAMAALTPPLRRSYGSTARSGFPPNPIRAGPQHLGCAGCGDGFERRGRRLARGSTNHGPSIVARCSPCASRAGPRLDRENRASSRVGGAVDRIGSHLSAVVRGPGLATRNLKARRSGVGLSRRDGRCVRTLNHGSSEAPFVPPRR